MFQTKIYNQPSRLSVNVENQKYCTGNEKNTHFNLPLFSLANFFKFLLCIFIFLFISFLFRQRKRYVAEYLPWAIENGKNAKPLMSVYWEERWEQDTEDLRKELQIFKLK